MTRRCTNPYLEEGHKLTDDTGRTIAVLIDGEFKRWEAGSWRSKFERDVTRGLKQWKISMCVAALKLKL